MAATTKRQLGEWSLNALSVGIVLFPVLAGALWVNNVFFSDTRGVSNLQTITESSTPKLFEEPLVSVTFDDGWESVYTKAAPLLEKHGIRSTQYIITGAFEDTKYLSYAQTMSLKNAGHEIASHTAHHSNLRQVTLSAVRDELHESDNFLQEHGLADDQMSFASPEGATSDKVIEEIKQIYGSHRNVEADLYNGSDHHDVNLRSNFDRYNIIGFSIRPGLPTSYIRAAISYAQMHNGWLVLVYHQVEETDTGDKEDFSTTEKEFDQQLKAIKETGVKTATVRSVIDAYDKRGSR